MKRFLQFLLCILLLFGEAVFSQTVSIQATQSTICAGGQVTLYAIGGASQAVWLPDNIDSRSITVAPAVTTTYTVTSGTGTATYTVNVCQSANCHTTGGGSFSPLLLNTGSDGLSSVLSYGATDAHWTYSRTINGTYLPTIVSDNSHIPGNYSKSSWPNAQWIGPNASLSSPGSGSYFFRVQFNLTAAEANSLKLSMQFMADNTVMGVRVNNVLVPNSVTPGGSIYGFQSPNAASVSMQGNWVEGLNTVTVEINDLGGFVGFVAQLNPKVEIPMPVVHCEDQVTIIEDTLEICKGDSIQLSAQGAVAYWWSPSAGLTNPAIANPKASPAVQTTYLVRGTDVNGQYSYDSVVVLVHDVPVVELGDNDLIKCSDQPIVLNASSPGTSVVWQDGSTEPIYVVSEAGIYYVTVTNQCGSASDTVRVQACCETIHVPNLFTPNDDHHNDVFYIGCLGNGGWHLHVFNCWGSLVYSSKDYRNNWDGSNVSDGVYYYELSKSNRGEYKGWVQILR